MTLETVAPTWRHKYTVDDTIVFGGDLAANGSSPASWASGAFSRQRACALAIGDYLELDFTLDAKTNGHGIAVGLSVFDPDRLYTSMVASWVWDTDQTFKARESGAQKYTAGVIVLPMSARIIYNAGVLTFRSNAGVDTLRWTSTRPVDSIYDDMLRGLCIDAAFYGTSGKFHATLKGGTTSSPEIPMDGSTGRLGLAAFDAQGVVMETHNQSMLREFQAQGLPPPATPRPTEGKIWPRNK